jgi:flavin-dependent dehydrogenase
VCGEYISNEVLPFLQHLGFDPFNYGASKITKLRVSSLSGKNIFANLDLGGFGISRYTIDHELSKFAEYSGAEILTSSRVTNIEFIDNNFIVHTSANETFTSKFVIGSYGKRDVLDKKLNRNFIRSHTGYMGVKYHIEINYAEDEIGLDNFNSGYCGIVKIENQVYNLCYLYQRSNNFNFKSVHELEEKVLFKNPVIKKIFNEAEFIFKEPEVINEISFAPKLPVENHIMMCGDSAGLITPLCGNGMSMAIHGAKLLCDIILKSNVLNKPTILPAHRVQLEQQYENIWKQTFSSRLQWGRFLQNMFALPAFTGIGLQVVHSLPPLERWLLKRTHGKVIPA